MYREVIYTALQSIQLDYFGIPAGGNLENNFSTELIAQLRRIMPNYRSIQFDVVKNRITPHTNLRITRPFFNLIITQNSDTYYFRPDLLIHNPNDFGQQDLAIEVKRITINPNNQTINEIREDLAKLILYKKSNLGFNKGILLLAALEPIEYERSIEIVNRILNINGNFYDIFSEDNISIWIASPNPDTRRPANMNVIVQTYKENDSMPIQIINLHPNPPAF